MNIITIANKKHMSYDFYIKHIMHAIEWKLNAMINKNKTLIKSSTVIGDILWIEKSKVTVFDHLIKYVN